MDDKNNAKQGTLDDVEARASQIAQREGRDTLSNEDRKRAYDEMREMAPPPDRPATESK